MGKITRIAILLDTSGSMEHIKRDALDAFNAINQTIKDNAAAGQETVVSLWTFGRVITEKFVNQPASRLRFIQDHEYRTVEGQSRLNDGIITACKSVHASMDLVNQEEACLLIAVTDGDENNSQHKAPVVKQFLERLQATGVWTIAMQVPKGLKQHIHRQYGIPLDNIREWEQNRRGAQEMGESTSSGLNTYFNARKSGARSVQTFFVEADLSKVTEADLRALPDVTARFKPYEMTKEWGAKDFVETNIGEGRYKTGAVYYELSKTEKKVQKGKLVLISKRGDKTIYGGAQARKLLGLPDGKDATLDIANLANYRVWIQSTAPNRVLVRGTTMLFDTQLNVDLEPTWTPVPATPAPSPTVPLQQLTPVATPTPIAQPATPTSKKATWPPMPGSSLQPVVHQLPGTTAVVMTKTPKSKSPHYVTMSEPQKPTKNFHNVRDKNGRFVKR